jgi:hypothetical protein
MIDVSARRINWLTGDSQVAGSERMKVIWLLSVMLLLVDPTFGQWRLWGRYGRDRTYFQRLQRTDEGVTVWVKKNRVISHLAFDCFKHKVRYLVAIESGEILDQVEGWRSPGPAYGEWLYIKACSSVTG